MDTGATQRAQRRHREHREEEILIIEALDAWQ
jgi:hypothetical protein